MVASLSVAWSVFVLGCSAVMGAWEEKVYFAPTKVLSGWSDLDPGSINCQTAGGRKPITSPVRREDKAIVWTGHATEPIPGFTCSLITLTTNCGTNFFGSQTTDRKTSFKPPPPSRCLDEYTSYLNQYEQVLEHPLPVCSWMSTQSASTEVIRIIPTVMEYDPFRDEYVDHKLKSGFCKASPCPTLREASLWFNTTKPIDACEFEDPVDILIGTTSETSNIAPGSELSSLSLMARTFEGACRHQMCSLDGYRLGTGEWVKLFTYNITDLPSCLNDTMTINTLTREGLVNHAIGAYAVSEESRRCKETKEKLMAGDPVSRSEMSSLQPQIVGKQPVYMFNGDRWQVASAEYDLVVYPKDKTNVLSTATLGVLHNTTNKVIWHFPHRVNADLVDGPNGIYWYRGVLRNPRIWEAHSSELFNISKAEYRRTVEVSSDKSGGEYSFDVNGQEVLDIPVKAIVTSHTFIWIVLGLVLVIIIVVYRCLCGPGMKYGRPGPMPLSVF